MTTADVRDVQTAMIWLAGSLQAATWPLLAVAFCWALPGPSSCSVPPGRRTWRCWATGPPSASAYVCSS
jgi:ABC-type Fe3+-siderophore transport system permease subunit